MNKKKNGNTTLMPHQFRSQNYWAYIYSARRKTPVSPLKTSAKNWAARLSTRNPDSQHRHSKNVAQILTGKIIAAEDVACLVTTNLWSGRHSESAHTKLVSLGCHLFQTARSVVSTGQTEKRNVEPRLMTLSDNRHANDASKNCSEWSHPVKTLARPLSSATEKPTEGSLRIAGRASRSKWESGNFKMAPSKTTCEVGQPK